ncbi:redoxin domain-containing protein [Bacillus sp. ISL-47]|uniref:redoxin domain-containing protein n=1 Tax=Bacillus sp. ISL-47 TaxID=2819130 RepID=UPI001BEBE404|nr:redoxin domain-containing protein [Bacillus sp. ISL-47]MBT2686851.1 redoxin domain-containing protein [Bacillus sp. ISL-47]MBT2706794.1 redoxin domain-containing protein [Pseudomonas sp. ISL-84]
MIQTRVGEYNRLNTQVLGISCDTSSTQEAYQRIFNALDFPLLSDFYPHGEVTSSFGLLMEDGRPSRAAVIIDQEGNLADTVVYPLSELPNHDDILERIKEKLIQ